MVWVIVVIVGGAVLLTGLALHELGWRVFLVVVRGECDVKVLDYDPEDGGCDSCQSVQG